MKKSVFFTLALSAVIIGLTVFPVKESSAVVAAQSEFEFWGTPRVVVCYDNFPTEVSIGGQGGSGGGGGTISIKIKYLEGRETKCDGFKGSCNGTACVPLGGQQV